MEDAVECYESLLQEGAKRLKGQERRLFMAEVTLNLCQGNARKAERRFGWGRETVAKGLHELQKGMRCLENFSARGRPRLGERLTAGRPAHSISNSRDGRSTAAAPPSATRTDPVMIDDSSEARKSTIEAISSGRAGRRRGTRDVAKA